MTKGLLTNFLRKFTKRDKSPEAIPDKATMYGEDADSIFAGSQMSLDLGSSNASLNYIAFGRVSSICSEDENSPIKVIQGSSTGAGAKTPGMLLILELAGNIRASKYSDHEQAAMDLHGSHEYESQTDTQIVLGDHWANHSAC